MTTPWQPTFEAINLDIGAGKRKVVPIAIVVGASMTLLTLVPLSVFVPLVAGGHLEGLIGVTLFGLGFLMFAGLTVRNIRAASTLTRDHGMQIDRYGVWWREGTRFDLIGWSELAGAGVSYTITPNGLRIRVFTLELVPASPDQFWIRHPALAGYASEGVCRILVGTGGLPRTFEHAVRTFAPHHWLGHRER